MSQGMDIKQIMDMPYQYLLDILKEKNEPEQKKSLISAFGG